MPRRLNRRFQTKEDTRDDESGSNLISDFHKLKNFSQGLTGSHLMTVFNLIINHKELGLDDHQLCPGFNIELEEECRI